MHEGPFHVLQALYLVLQRKSDIVRLHHGHDPRQHDLHLHVITRAEVIDPRAVHVQARVVLDGDLLDLLDGDEVRRDAVTIGGVKLR